MRPTVLTLVLMSFAAGCASEPCQSWLVDHRTGQTYCASPPPPHALPPEPPTANAGAVKAAPPPKVAKAAKAGKGKAKSKGKAASGPPPDPAVMAKGKELYTTICIACHQATGQGMPGIFPPLAGGGSFYGSPQNHAKIVVHGLTGEIEVNGTKYNSVMPPQDALSDEEIAAVLTYERNSWGNADGVVTPADVAAVR